MTFTDTVTTDLLYATRTVDGSKPYQYINVDPTTGVRKRNFEQKAFPMEIENLRGKEDTVSLDTAGFAFFHEPAQHKRFANDDEVEKEYYPESIELLKKLTGASRVVLFDHSAFHESSLTGASILILRP